MKIKEILTIDLTEDIKNVIDLENISEQEIKEEIENYIVTDGLAKEYADFVTLYISNILETGVWISGFYGSGKSYFGKILGYLLNNKPILGTSARERILQRFTGITDEALVKNELSGLETVKSRVIFLDIAKQDTSKGFSYALFRNFLKSLDLPENEHGYVLYQLMINEKQANIHDFIFERLNKDWGKLKTKIIEYARAAKEIFIKQGNTEDDYNNLLTTIRREIDQFSAGKLREEINNYLQIVKDERVVFLFDEAGEAINQGKFTLLDLEGVSEALSSFGNKVWTIAIAQEKLDDVINNSNVSKAQLTKVTDRFKTKIHLEATEVDQIIKSRLLSKNQQGTDALKENFRNNSGKIADHSALIGSRIIKTNDANMYATYYPFYKSQFDLMQNFLFGTKGYVSTKVAARGMIITTYDILRKQMQNEDLFNVVSGWQIAKEAQPSPNPRLVNRFDNAERILKEADSPISGRRLLETIHFLTEAEVTPANLQNIIKAYISDPEQYYQVQNDIEKALEALIEAKVLLVSNNTYKITSDIEQRLLDEMNTYTVQGFVKKNKFVAFLKTSQFIKSISRITDHNINYDFYITTDNDDELTNPANKFLKIKIKSIYNISDDRAKDLKDLKVQYQHDKDLLWIVPDNSNFNELDKLIDEVERINYLEQKYNNPNTEEGRILTGFSVSKSEKEERIKQLVESALKRSNLVYLFNDLMLNDDNAISTIQDKQKEIIRNVYTKRLNAQLSDNVAAVVIKEANDARLHQYFHGDEFKFFDDKGNFIGENLKVSEEILYKIRNSFVDGKTLETELEQPPTGFTFGTVISTLAALMRAGKVIAKYNGEEKFSWRDDGVTNIFKTAREFRKASFKAVSKSLSLWERQELAQFLLDIEADKYIDRKVDYNTNDFELVNAVRDLAKHFVDKLAILKNTEKDFDKLFANAEEFAEVLTNHTGSVSEANYIDKAHGFLTQKDDFIKAIQSIEKIEKFIRNKLPKAKQWRTFALSVKDELTKAARNHTEITQLVKEFEEKYQQDISANYSNLNQIVQQVKDHYHDLFSEAMKECAAKYSEILELTESLIAEINTLPAGLNVEAEQKVLNLKLYAVQRIRKEIDLDFDVKDKVSRFAYSEVLSFIELYESKKNEIEILKAGLVREKQPKPEPGAEPKKKTYSTKLPAHKMKVAEFKNWLKQELQKLASAKDDDEITIE